MILIGSPKIKNKIVVRNRLKIKIYNEEDDDLLSKKDNEQTEIFFFIIYF